MNRAGVIIPAAGSGSRMKADRPKQFLPLAGVPVLIHTLRAFLDTPCIGTIVLAVARETEQASHALLHDFLGPGQRGRIIVTRGGATRQQSVRAGLAALPATIDPVLVHDAARPLVSPDLIEDCVHGIERFGAVIAAVPVNDTLKAVDGKGVIRKTVNRAGLFRAQTPQGARRTLLEKAFARAGAEGFTGTDEASLLERAGIEVAIVSGEERNIKITHPGDLLLARALLEGKSMQRIGHGFDAHRLVEGRALVLGGVTIDHPLGLLGHSDADVVCHALMDAMLGSLGLGDIGRHFPDSDDRYQGARSLDLLGEVWKMASERGWRLGNGDLTIVCQRPRLAPHLEAMRDNLAAACRVEPKTFNIKATTTEKMGYTGRGEGIAAHAVVLLEKNHDR